MKKLLLVLLPFIPLLAANYPSPPPPGQYVQDLSGVIDSNYEDKINCLCRELERTTTAEMAVLTISSFVGEDPREYSTALGNYWGVGQADEDNGVVMVVAIDDREVFTATGLGIVKIMPDSVVYAIYEDVLVPSFRAGEYGQGIYQAMQLYAQIITEFYIEHPEGIHVFFNKKDSTSSQAEQP